MQSYLRKIARIPVLTYEEAIIAGENFTNYQSREIKPEDMAVITYTSGTSGQPKGVIYSHKSSNAIIQHYVEHYTFSKKPLNHQHDPYEYVK